MTLSEAFDNTISLKRSEGRDATVRKLEFARKSIGEFCDISSLALHDIDRGWIDTLSRWLNETKHLSANTRATYMRALYSVLRMAHKLGEMVDLSSIPMSMRSNTASRTAPAPAVSADTNARMWFAMKCRSIDSAAMSERIAGDYPSTEVFRTDVERLVATPTGKHRCMVELLKDILFFRTTLATCEKMKRNYHDAAYIFDYPADGRRKMAIVPDMDMKMFMYFNDIAPDRILLYFPDEAIHATIAEGTPVTIADGRFRGATGKIIGTN
ncbi:MAG: phage integrase SAM-like domain-containing protein, partial [Duncaniella sp.]|nr:phage integrase SAM-like domain-containing protein [Duncaniella sp.]